MREQPEFMQLCLTVDYKPDKSIRVSIAGHTNVDDAILSFTLHFIRKEIINHRIDLFRKGP